LTITKVKVYEKTCRWTRNFFEPKDGSFLWLDYLRSKAGALICNNQQRFVEHAAADSYTQITAAQDVFYYFMFHSNCKLVLIWARNSFSHFVFCYSLRCQNVKEINAKYNF